MRWKTMPSLQFLKKTLNNFIEEYIIGDEDTSQLPAREIEDRITNNKQELQEGGYQRDKLRVLNRNTLHNFTLT